MYMKLPKLKRYYAALSPEQYKEFETSRQIVVSPAVSIDLQTGQISGRTHITLHAQPDACDTEFRTTFHYSGRVYVLRVPAEHIDRDQLLPATNAHTWQYRQTLQLDHCGVMAFDLQKS
jgi:hypothetical protein